ncbi:hypothetical protein [Dactylosporangium sp. NPDC049140]|uniref:hypothetical protein n=1 Tax=Dactylosporangium sp. NPDC049140 TaxID=3155647 RepID=UPI0034008E5D
MTSDNVNDFVGVPPGLVGPIAASIVRAANPHVTWAELDGHGYGVLEVRPPHPASKVRSFKVNAGVSRLVSA